MEVCKKHSVINNEHSSEIAAIQMVNVDFHNPQLYCKNIMKMSPILA